MPGPSRRDVLQFTAASVATLGLSGLTSAGVTDPPLPSFHFDHVLGTSLDVWANGDIHRIESVVLEEIERLRRIFSTYDSESELSRLNRSSGPIRVSREICDVLATYAIWHRRSTGACSAEMGDLVGLWQQAEQAGQEPPGSILARMASGLRQPGWTLNGSAQVVTRGPRTLNLNSVAKGYILDRVAQAVRATCPGVGNLVVDLGGDLRVLGNEIVGIQNPHRAGDNTRALTFVRLRDQAIATSGGYQRYYRLNGQRLSHLIDPRTGRPAGEIASATVVAPTSTLANTLATLLCILSPAQGMQLIAATPGTACLIVTAGGQQIRSEGFSSLDSPCAARPDEQPAAWPGERQVNITLELPRPTTGRAIRRPYVAVWVEDADGKAIRTLAEWGNSPKWINTLTNWWKVARNDANLIKAVSKATRGPGKYDLVWDGKNDAGQAVPQGTYTIKVEVHREHGKHLVQTGKIDCKGDDANVTLEKNDETAATLVQYAKKK